MPDLARTTITLPPITLRSRCHICQLFHTDPDLFDQINEKLLTGVGQTKLAAWLKTKGFHTAQALLSRHLRKHLLPHFQDALLVEQTARAIAQATGGMQNVTLAGVILKILAMKVHDAMGTLDGAKIAQLDPLDLIKAATSLAQTMAYAERTAADSALKAEELELKKLRLAKTKEELAALAVDWLRKELAGRPDLVEYMRQALALPEQAGESDTSDMSDRSDRPDSSAGKAKGRRK